MSLAAWDGFVDFGMACLLLVGGQQLRARLRIAQRFFLPANVIAGGAGLLLGANGLGLIPLSKAVSVYPGMLIILIFASLPFSTSIAWTTSRGSIGQLWSYSTAAMCAQWGFGLLLVILLLRQLWPELNPAFGAMLASGFVGGHGTAAAVGSVLAERGFPEARSLAMTAATVGIVSSILGGMLWINWAARNKHTRFVAGFDELPSELRSGQAAPAGTASMGRETVLPIAIDPLIFHVAIVATAGVAGHLIAAGSAGWMGNYRMPAFCLAFLSAVVLKRVMRWSGILHLVDRPVISRVGGSCTDLLVVFGIASIDLIVLAKYAYPLAALLALGLLFCWALIRFLGPPIFPELWFEKSLFTWGWITGIMAMAIALLRIVDPDGKSRVLDHFALAYLAIGPVEVLLVTLGPILITQGYGLAFGGMTAAVAVGLLTATRLANRAADNAHP